MERYSTNLTDKQWQAIEKIINPQERKRKYSLRNIRSCLTLCALFSYSIFLASFVLLTGHVATATLPLRMPKLTRKSAIIKNAHKFKQLLMNAILYLLKTGCQWRMIPKDFAPWESVYYYFSKWKNKGVIEELLDNIRSKVRIMSGREESSSLGIIDSRSVKTSHHVDSDRGVDGNKKVKGRKQHIIVDTPGNLMSVAVHEANVHDSKGAPEVIENLSCKFPCLTNILADGGYRGNFAEWVLDKFGWELEVVLRPDECPSKFKVILKR